MNIKCLYSSLVPVLELQPHPANRNSHSQRQIEVLAKIIAKNGQRSPIVVSNLSGKINKGHCRWEAIKLLGWEKCAVEYQDYANELEELNDRISDNEISRYAEFQQTEFLEDIKKLNLKLEEVDFEEFGLIDFKFEKMPEIEINEKEIDENIETENTCPSCGYVW